MHTIAHVRMIQILNSKLNCPIWSNISMFITCVFMSKLKNVEIQQNLTRFSVRLRVRGGSALAVAGPLGGGLQQAPPACGHLQHGQPLPAAPLGKM